MICVLLSLCLYCSGYQLNWVYTFTVHVRILKSAHTTVQTTHTTAQTGVCAVVCVAMNCPCVDWFSLLEGSWLSRVAVGCMSQLSWNAFLRSPVLNSNMSSPLYQMWPWLLWMPCSVLCLQAGVRCPLDLYPIEVVVQWCVGEGDYIRRWFLNITAEPSYSEVGISSHVRVHLPCMGSFIMFLLIVKFNYDLTCVYSFVPQPSSGQWRERVLCMR